MTRKLAMTLVFAAGMAAGAAGAQNKITVVSWGGSYQESQRETMFDPFTEATGIKVIEASYSGGLGQVRAMVEAGNVTWDVFVGEPAIAQMGCDVGVLEEIDPSILPAAADGTPVQEDFLPGTLQPCGIGEMIWALSVAYDKDKIPEPDGIEALFDLETYPGRRALPRRPEYNLEWALIADGVPLGEVYDVLATQEGVDRAFAKLDTIKDQVVWWAAGAQPPQLLADGEVVMAGSFHSRIVSSNLTGGTDFGIIYDAMLYDIDMWMIPKGTENLEQALRFIKFASQEDIMAALSSQQPFGPVRKSAGPLVAKHPTAGVEMSQFLPTHGDRIDQALQIKADFWADNAEDLTSRFQSWLVK